MEKIIDRIKYIKYRIGLELKPWGFVYSFVIFPIIGMGRKYGFFISQEEKQKLEELKNKHKGERCFVIATGPSLRLDDILRLKDEYTFAVNTIFELFEKTTWRPSYYVLVDPEHQKRLQKNHILDFDSFATENCILCSINKKISKGMNNIYLHINFLDHVYNFGKSTKFKYSDNLVYGFYDNNSVTQDSLMLAMYMGFSEIYLLGADNNYLGKKQHFTITENEPIHSDKRALLIQQANDDAYKFVSEVAKKKGVSIINITRGGNVNVFERKNIEEVI